MPSDLFTTSYLGTFAGLVAVTYLLVQFFKEPIKKHLSDWWIRLFAVGIALIIQLFVLYVAGNFTIEPIGLAVLNAFLVAITAAGMHDLSQPSTATNFNSAIFQPTTVLLKSQVPDVSPPVNTPQTFYSNDLESKEEPSQAANI